MQVAVKSADPKWLYFRVYPGQTCSRGIDFVAAHVVPRANGFSPHAPWFFVRSLDVNGLHLRYRLQVAAKEQPRLTSQISELFEGEVARLGQRALPPSRPFVSGSEPRSWSGTQLSAVVTDTYEPEYSKFGVAAMPVSEVLFEASSRIAVCILERELQGAASRKIAAPALMLITLAELIDHPRERAAFWVRYANYWSGQGLWSGATHFRARFGARSAELVSSGAWARSLNRARNELAQPLHEWATALRHARLALTEIAARETVELSSFAFHHLHLMNNRLGITKLDEAYIATLLAVDVGGCTQ